MPDHITTAVGPTRVMAGPAVIHVDDLRRQFGQLEVVKGLGVAVGQ